MAAIISENYVSRPFTVGLTRGRELIFDLQNSEDEEEIRLLIIATAPTVYLGLVVDTVSAEPLGNGVWKGYARYVRLENDSEYTFDTGGGTQKVTQSLATIASFAPPGLVAPDFQGAIGVSEDKVEGVNIVSPAFQFTETHTFLDAFVTGAYKRILFLLTGTFNNAAFKGFDAGECSFLGASGTKRGDEKWSITFRFAGSPNVVGATIGSITGVSKLGWDYLWVRYADYEDTFAFALVKRPVAAYVERVATPEDFSTLGIGVI